MTTTTQATEARCKYCTIRNTRPFYKTIHSCFPTRACIKPGGTGRRVEAKVSLLCGLLPMNTVYSLSTRSLSTATAATVRIVRSICARTPEKHTSRGTQPSLLFSLPWAEPTTATAVYSYLMGKRSSYPLLQSHHFRHSRRQTPKTSWAPSLALPPLIPYIMTWFFPPTMEDVYELDTRGASSLSRCSPSHHGRAEWRFWLSLTRPSSILTNPVNSPCSQQNVTSAYR